MKNAQKIILYLTSVLLLGCLGWIFIHAVCAVPQAKKHIQRQKHASGDRGRDFVFASVVPEAFRCQPFVAKAHASYRNCGCFSDDSDTAVSVSVLCEILGGI